MIQSTPYKNIRYIGIDAAKSGKVNSYLDYKPVAAKINKAIGGTKSRMPYFFQFSKNGRREIKDIKTSTINNSTMNRICNRFMLVKNINMNVANIPMFNWKMLLDKECNSTNDEAVKVFIDRSGTDNASNIECGEMKTSFEKFQKLNYDAQKEETISILINKFNSLEEIYPFIVKYLFADDSDKIACKQNFWRIFGNIAIKNLEANLQHYHICPTCGCKIPDWQTHHRCKKNGFKTYECIDCGIICERKGPKQCRCQSCQEKYRMITKRNWQRNEYHRKKE